MNPTLKKRTTKSARPVAPPSAELADVLDDIRLKRGDQKYVPVSRPKKIGDVMAQLLARRGYAQQRSAAEVVSAWNEAAGTALACHTRCGAIRSGTLEVVVANSAISQELTFRKSQLVAELIHRLPQHGIKNIRFRTGKLNGQK